MHNKEICYGWLVFCKKFLINSWKFFDKQSDKVERVLKIIIAELLHGGNDNINRVNLIHRIK